MKNESERAGKTVKKFFVDFKNFAMRGNVIDLAVGVMIGAAFGQIVTSLVNDIFMPLIGLLTGGINLNGLSFAVGEAAVTYGAFLTNVIDFILIALCVFMFVRLVEKVTPKKPGEPKEATRTCPYCRKTISALASKCPDCTADVVPTEKDAAMD